MKRLNILVVMALIGNLSFNIPAHAAGLTIDATTKITSDIPTVGQIWKGDIPVLVSYPTDSYSEKLEFPITGILPISELADRARGVEVQFAIWSDTGVKLGSQTVYSFSWNPVGPNTMVSLYLYQAPALYGKHTMLITTSYTTSTTGLLSRYLKDEKKVQIEIKKVLPNKVPEAPVLMSSWVGSDMIAEFEPIIANPPVTKYQLTFSSLLSPNLAPTSTLSFGTRTIIMEGIDNKFIVTKTELSRYFASGYAAIGSPYILMRVEAVNALGNSNLSNGISFEPKYFGLLPYSLPMVPTPTPTPTATSERLTVKKSTITCIKGKLTKKVTAVKPVCPAGYKKK